ncbi:hypothetical protein TGAM01_v203421 [Trichoderma gamsii]|uniref:Uncharacterized protein n=1 Tax=Trichoderma gamsii TaxID=398673 RepID=A0A2P4ZTN5_9HYPO|nr:hypothetical protein TGAM01_v203421 [Trichoderma gamsii]PON27654.1 hypothetical protein TGAM01_v203421 [Trichoderma gamsii]
MAGNSVEEYQRLINRANEYHKQALWQEKLRLLQEALFICEEPAFPEADRRKQELLFDVAGIWRRLGQYDRAEKTLQQSLEAYASPTSSFRASVLGELGVMARHNNRYHEARDLFREQGRLAREEPSSIESEAEICRAIGNEGMTTYNLWQLSDPTDPTLLDAAFSQLQERITRAQDLQRHISKVDPRSKYLAMVQTWEIIAMDRLTLCYIAAGKTEAAVQIAEESQRKQSRQDPTVTAFSKFYYGNALWHDGQAEKALKQWNAPSGTCSAPMALCKEPGKEHNEHLQLMADAGVDFDTYDEQGFSALDHAVLSDSPHAREAIPIVEKALRSALQLTSKDVDKEILIRKQQAELRRQYRTIFQEHMRPVLRKKPSGAFNELRKIYARFISQDTKERRMFSRFHYMKFTDFVNHGELPISTSGLDKQFSDAMEETQKPKEDDFVIFISYRWIGGGNGPDDESGTQWHRIINAVEKFKKVNPHLDSDSLGLWLDYFCVDQLDGQEKERGVDALPLAVVQCNAMISLVDETYYERAWCAVEVMLMRAIVESYGLHQWWEDRDGSFEEGDTTHVLDVGNLKLTEEKSDRPKIDFLVRQSKLLGRDVV